MKTIFFFNLCTWVLLIPTMAQKIIPMDTMHWSINANAYVLENYKGSDAIYIQNGQAVLKDTLFINGTIEFDIFLTERQGFPGIQFRIFDNGNAESFYLRAHLSGKPDANNGLPIVNGLSAWQLYFGPAYSFPYEYNYNDWTHVKMVINNDKAQVYMDHAEKPHLSYYLKHPPREGRLAIGGSAAPMHYANFSINKNEYELVDFKVAEKALPTGLIQSWVVSDKFEEQQLQDLSNLSSLISNRKWEKSIKLEENGAANISYAVSRYGSPGNTVFTKITINADEEMTKLFEFGYSDRVVAILNGLPIYAGTNRWRSRDYRYLGTVGLFDAIYLPLKKGENTLLFAVSEDFGGWGITGKFQNQDGITIK